MSLPLPGTPLPLLGYRLDRPYSVREDDTHLFLCFGSEEVVAQFDQAVTIAELEQVMRIDRGRRAARGFSPRSYGLPA